MPELFSLRLERLDEPGMRVAEGVDGDTGAKIEIALAGSRRSASSLRRARRRCSDERRCPSRRRTPRPSWNGRGVFSPAPRGKKTCAWRAPEQKIKKPPTSGGSNTTLDTRRRSCCQRKAVADGAYRGVSSARYAPAVEFLSRKRQNPTYPLSRIVCGLLATSPCQYPLSLTALPCRRDSACCNFLPSGHEIWRRLAPLLVLCIGPVRTLGIACQRCPRLERCVLSAFPKFLRL